MREQAFEALEQWQLDTGKFASASEENAFIDGYRAGASAQRERLDTAVEAAKLFQSASQRKGLALEQIADLPLGDHQAQKIAQEAIHSAPQSENGFPCRKCGQLLKSTKHEARKCPRCDVWTFRPSLNSE